MAPNTRTAAQREISACAGCALSRSCSSAEIVGVHNRCTDEPFCTPPRPPTSIHNRRASDAMTILAMAPRHSPASAASASALSSVKPPLFPRDCLDQRTPVAKAFDLRVSEILI